MLGELETILGVQQVEHALALLTCSKHSMSDSEMIDLLAFDEIFHSSTTYGKEFIYNLANKKFRKTVFIDEINVF